MSTRQLPVEIADGIHWIGGCVPIPLHGGTVHQHSSAFLITGTEATALIDTSNGTNWSEVEGQLAQILRDRQLDWIIPTHPELAHVGNLERLLVRYPRARLFGDLRDYHLYFPRAAGRLVPKGLGDFLDLGSHELVLVEALMKDLTNTQWLFERTQRVLFVGDAFAYTHNPDEEPHHRPGECALMTDELPDAPTLDQATMITRAAMYWTLWVDATDIFDRWRSQVEKLRPRLIAPAHGNVIVNAGPVTDRVADAYRVVYEQAAASSA